MGEDQKLSRHNMPKYVRLVPILFWLAASAAGAARVEFVGDYSIDIGPAADSVTVEIAKLRNASPPTAPAACSYR